MATAALQIDLLEANENKLTGYNFYTYEVADVQVRSRIRWKRELSQSGVPTYFILQQNVTPFRTLLINIRIHGESTAIKLRAIRDHIFSGGGNLVRVYPALRDEPDIFIDCIADLNTFVDKSFFSGLYKAGDIVPLFFVEYAQTAAAVVVDDVVIP
jgi:hypothetical protein